jgi:hypothetical protein
MKPSPPTGPVRLLNLRQGSGADVARMIRNAIRTPKEPVPHLKSRIRHTLRRRSASRRRYLRVVLVSGAIFLSGGVVGAMVQPLLLHLRDLRKAESVEDIYPTPHTTHSPGSGRGRFAQRQSTVSQGVLALDQSAEAPIVPPMPVPPASAEQVEPPSAQMGPAAQTAKLLGGQPVRTIDASVTRAMPGLAWAEAAQHVAKPAAPRASLSSSASLAVRQMLDSADPVERVEDRGHLDPGSGRMSVPESASGQHDRPMPPTSPRLASLEPSAFVSAPGSLAPSALAPLRAPILAQAPASEGINSRYGVPKTMAAAAGVPTTIPTVPASLPSEQALLARAVRSLRLERRPEDALVALDAYETRFPNGSMLPEATRLRTEALLQLGYKRAALAELSSKPEQDLAGDQESRLVRGELRAAAGHWREALDDFDAVVSAWLGRGPSAAGSLSPRLTGHFERALWGRASARSHLGDETGARADLQALLRRFRHGRFAAQAAQLLGELR